MQKCIASYPDYATSLSPRLLLGLWHPAFIEPAKRYLPTLKKFHIGLSTHIARKYFWQDMDGFSIAFPMLTSTTGQRFLQDCKAAGKEVMTWTVNEKQDMRIAKTWGVQWLITDRVGYAVDARREVSVSTKPYNFERTTSSILFQLYIKWDDNPEVLQMSTLAHLSWSWLNWKHYAIPQVSINSWPAKHSHSSPSHFHLSSPSSIVLANLFCLVFIFRLSPPTDSCTLCPGHVSPMV